MSNSRRINRSLNKKKIERAESPLEKKYREFMENLPDMVYEVRIFKPDVSPREERKIIKYVDKIRNAGQESLAGVIENAIGMAEDIKKASLPLAAMESHQLTEEKVHEDLLPAASRLVEMMRVHMPGIPSELRDDLVCAALFSRRPK